MDSFIDRLQNIVGKNVKMGSGEIYLSATYYVLDHDSFGNSIKNPTIFFERDNLLIYEEDNSFFNKDIYYFKDNRKNLKVYYDAINLNYLGYSDKNSSKITIVKSFSKITKVYSIRDKLLNLGFPDDFFNLNLVSKNESKDRLEKDPIPIEDIIKYRTENMREIINKFIKIIFSVKNRKKGTSIYSVKENTIINDSINRIRNFKTKDEGNSKAIFKHWKYISNYPFDSTEKIDQLKKGLMQSKVKENLGFNFIKSSIIHSFNSVDSKFLFFLIYSLNRLFDYNSDSKQNNQILGFLIVRIIGYNFENYRLPINEIDLRKFYKIISINAPNIDERLRIVGSYEELLNSQEIDDENKGLFNNKDKENEKKVDEEKEAMIDFEEEQNALDIDDYEEDDTGYMDFD